MGCPPGATEYPCRQVHQLLVFGSASGASLGSVWGYRRELRDADRSLSALAEPSLAGGLAGAILLSRTPTEVFDRLVPRLLIVIGFGMAAALLVKAL